LWYTPDTDGGIFLEDFFKVSFLGPAGTYSQQAAEFIFPNAELVAMADIAAVFESISDMECDAGVVPLENSTEGAVNATLDALLCSDGLAITSLLVLPINHVLMAKSELCVPDRILAHPQALAQCRGYIRARCPRAELITCASNAEAAMLVSDTDKSWAAVGPASAASQYGLCILGEDIQDSPLNSTAFIRVELSQDQTPRQGCRTSIVFSTENKPGALCRMLNILDGINMTKILSRPMPPRPGEYIFFVDIEDYQAEDAKKALRQMEDEATMYKFLGSYPVNKWERH
jgi:prephenate dehydratase